MSAQATPPAWVRKRDGRVVPFDADKISRALFAATETLGRPDAFLARELTDGVLHFLALENEAETLPSAQIAELVVKTVRELGQPALAAAFADRGARRARVSAPAAADEGAEIVLRYARRTPLRELLPAWTREYTLRNVYTRDLIAAQGDGLLTIAGLEAPDELAAGLLGPFAPGDEGAGGVIAALEQVRRFAGEAAVLDGPDHVLARAGCGDEGGVRLFARELVDGLRITRLAGVINLNCPEPPAWVGDLGRGPLFAGRQPSPAAEHRGIADRLLRRLLGAPTSANVRVDWHLAAADFAGQEARQRLLRVAPFALQGAALAFVFERPRRPTPLAEGIDRQHPAVLLTSALHLPALLRQPGLKEDAARFVQKLGSLARLALSAGVQKREYLRRLRRDASAVALTSGFLLDRARLVVVPVGLDHVVRALTGRGLCSGGAALELGKQIVVRLRDVLRQDGRMAHLDACLGGPCEGTPSAAAVAEEAVGGLTAWEPSASLKNQIRAAGVLHAVAERGTLVLFVPADATAEQLVDGLEAAWESGEVARLRLNGTDGKSR